MDIAPSGIVTWDVPPDQAPSPDVAAVVCDAVGRKRGQAFSINVGVGK